MSCSCPPPASLRPTSLQVPPPLLPHCGVQPKLWGPPWAGCGGVGRPPQPRGAAKRTYIGRAERRARATPARSAPWPPAAAAVLLRRPPSAAPRRGRRPAPAGPLAARLPPVVSVLGAQPAREGSRGQAGSRRGTRPLRPGAKWVGRAPTLGPLPGVRLILQCLTAPTQVASPQWGPRAGPTFWVTWSRCTGRRRPHCRSCRCCVHGPAGLGSPREAWGLGWGVSQSA